MHWNIESDSMGFYDGDFEKRLNVVIFTPIECYLTKRE